MQIFFKFFFLKFGWQQGWSTLKKLKNERPFKQPSLTTFTPFFQRKRQRHKWTLNLIVFKNWHFLFVIVIDSTIESTNWNNKNKSITLKIITKINWNRNIIVSYLLIIPIVLKNEMWKKIETWKKFLYIENSIVLKLLMKLFD